MAKSAITLHSGLLGAGKTLKCVIDALETWRRGGFVFSNISYNWEECKKYCLDRWGVVLKDEQFVELKASQIPHFYRHVRRGTRAVPVKVQIDECATYFNARMWAKNPPETADAIRHCRKLHIDLTLICQDPDFLDKQFRALCNYTMKCRDMAKFHIPILSKFLLFNCYDSETDTKVTHLSSWWRKDARVYRCYDTDALVSDFDIAEQEELGPVQLEQIGRPKRITMKGFLIVLIGIAALAWNTKSYWWPFGSDKDDGKKTEKLAVKESRPKIEKGKGLYDLVVEELRYRFPTENGFVLATVESGEFETGQLSRYGMVEKIQGSRVLVRTPEGRPLYVLATSSRGSAEKLKAEKPDFGLSLVGTN